MLITTLCYIEHKGCTLMLHRTKKAHDINEGKWIGVGGKFADRESPEECLLREVFEETGYTLKSWRFRGFITFLQENYETEYMCLYTADDFLVPADAKAGASSVESAARISDTARSASTGTAAGPLRGGSSVESAALLSVHDHPAFASDNPASWPVPDCDEGVLAWIPQEQISSLNLWPGDRIFLRLLAEREAFFSLKLLYSGDDLLEAVLDGEPLT